MKVLIVCSGNAPEGQQFDIKLHQAFIYEQVESLKMIGIEFDFFLIREKGLLGYLKHYKILIDALNNNYDLIHAHNGLSGFLANLQSKVPVITTYHGSDINLFLLRLISYFPIIMSEQNIVVSKKLEEKLLIKKNLIIIPCGVDLNTFYPFPDQGIVALNKPQKRKAKILFSSSFSNPIKNYPLASSAIEKLTGYQIELIELKNQTRDEVCTLMNASDLLVLTSFSEGSPMVVKEAMACNCPIVSTDVGDVSTITDNIEGCFITAFDAVDVANKIEKALKFVATKGRTKGRDRIIAMGLDNENIALQIKGVYEKVIEKMRKLDE